MCYLKISEKLDQFSNDYRIDDIITSDDNLITQVSTYMSDFKSNLSSLTTYINTTIDTIVNKRHDKFERLFEVNIADLSTKLSSLSTLL